MPNAVPEPFRGVFRASDSHRAKRNRAAVSCTACQKRKSRCDRQHPCGACEKRGHRSACHFVPSKHGEESSSGSKRELLSRLTQLEDLVKGMAEDPRRHDTVPAPAAAAVGDDATPPATNSEDTTVYYGPTSWAALVESIHGIQSALEAEPAPPPKDPDVVFGDLAPVTVDDIVSCLPTRRDCDRIISAYFNSKFVALPFLHVHHFRRRYEAFWESPSSTNLLWVSILFSVLAIGTMIVRNKEPFVAMPMATTEPRVYMVMAARCLVSGHYIQAKVYSVEAILAHAHSRNLTKKDSDPTLWSLYGLAVRIAQQRGYHRNPRNAKLRISPFDAEMRRRVWFTVQSFDLLFSFQHGMPPMVHEGDCDVEKPINLSDDDFDEDCHELPPARPSTDPTPILSYICKADLLPTLRRINRRALGIKTSAFEQANELAAELEQWHESMPPYVTYRPISETAFTDANYTIMHRIMLELMYLMSRAVLYCPYLNSAEEQRRQGATMTNICRDAALRIIDIHLEVDRESQPGGRIYEDRYMVTSLTLNDFLNAAMIICVDLVETRHASNEDREARVNILRKSYRVWLDRCDESNDAKFACQVLRAILNRVEGSPQSTTSNGDQSLTSGSTVGASQVEEAYGLALDNNYWGTDLHAQACVDLDNLPTFDAFFTNTETLNWVGRIAPSKFSRI
ncbi:hypothetical protein S40293_07500 [Stachybotrys chartarum IBT 40293]|nr:hypothetical protein S40293_07500 [Stachybotrys chartarum IBT 40293]